ncbi:MAG: hypothetical protein R6X34_09180, partial [Chloroflexota bacterium]
SGRQVNGPAAQPVGCFGLYLGAAATYTELLHPSQSNAQPLIQFMAEGALEDGRSFLVDVSQGAPDVANHITIEMGE